MKVQQVKAYFRDGEVSLLRKGLAFFAVAYAVMPVDLLPDKEGPPLGRQSKD